MKNKIREWSIKCTTALLVLQWLLLIGGIWLWVDDEKFRTIEFVKRIDWPLQFLFALGLVVGKLDQIILTFDKGSKGGSTLWRAHGRLLSHYSWVLAGLFLTKERDSILAITRGMIVGVSLALSLSYLRHGKTERTSFCIVVVIMIAFYFLLKFAQGASGEELTEWILYISWLGLLFMSIHNLYKQYLVTLREGYEGLSMLEPLLTTSGACTSSLHIYYLYLAGEGMGIVFPALWYLSLMFVVGVAWCIFIFRPRVTTLIKQGFWDS